MRILTEMAEGNAITLMPIHAELTTQQAASILGVSRPCLGKKKNENQLTYRRGWRNPPDAITDLKDYKNRIDADRAKVLEQLAAHAQQMTKGY
jgi:hypothetical protein